MSLIFPEPQPATRARRRDVWALLTKNPRATLEELRQATGASSTSMIRLDLKHLERLGYIRRGPQHTAATLVVLVPLYTEGEG